MALFWKCITRKETGHAHTHSSLPGREKKQKTVWCKELQSWNVESCCHTSGATHLADVFGLLKCSPPHFTPSCHMSPAFYFKRFMCVHCSVGCCILIFDGQRLLLTETLWIRHSGEHMVAWCEANNSAAALLFRPAVRVKWQPCKVSVNKPVWRIFQAYRVSIQADLIISANQSDSQSLYCLCLLPCGPRLLAPVPNRCLIPTFSSHWRPSHPSGRPQGLTNQIIVSSRILNDKLVTFTDTHSKTNKSEKLLGNAVPYIYASTSW